MATGEPAGTVRVEVVWGGGPHDTRRVPLTLPAGATAWDAVRASGLLEAAPASQSATLGVWGRACEPGRVLREGDRVELYRGLQVDPKEARRLRHGRGARRA